MDSSQRSPTTPTRHNWWALPTGEELGLIAIKYRLVLLGFIVAIAFVYGHGRVAEMDDRLLHFSSHGVRGFIQYQIGRYDSAAAAYRNSLRKGGWKEWTNGDDAYTALLRGNLTEAARLADLHLMKEPDSAEAWLTQGEIALEEGNIRRASEAFDHVISLDDKQFDALLLSAVAHTRSGNIDRAIDRLRSALRYNYAGRRITTFLWGLQTAGEVRRDSLDGLRWTLLAHYYRYLRIFDPSNASWARNAATRAIELGSRLDDAYITLGVLQEKTGDYDAALPYFIKAVEANPRNPEAYRRAASIYRHRGSDLLNEYKMWQGAVMASPVDGFYRDNLVAFLTERFGDYPQALDLSLQALNEDSKNKDFLRRVAELYQRLGKHETALRHYQDLLALQPGNPGTFEAIGYSLVSLERYDDAVTSYKNALAISSRRPQSYSGLGAVYARQGKYEESIRAYETALEVGGDDINIRVYLCSQYWATNRYHDAEACLKHVLYQDPYNKGAMQIYPYVMKGLDYARHAR